MRNAGVIQHCNGGVLRIQFRRHGKAMVDTICDYYASMERFPVRSQVPPGYLSELIPSSAPEHGEDLQAVMRDVHEKIMPGLELCILVRIAICSVCSIVVHQQVPSLEAGNAMSHSCSTPGPPATCCVHVPMI